MVPALIHQCSIGVFHQQIFVILVTEAMEESVNCLTFSHSSIARFKFQLEPMPLPLESEAAQQSCGTYDNRLCYL